MCATFAKRAVIPNGVRDLSQTQKITLGKLCDQSSDCGIPRPAVAGLGMTSACPHALIGCNVNVTLILFRAVLCDRSVFAVVIASDAVGW
jgi:hypothetical protein